MDKKWDVLCVGGLVSDVMLKPVNPDFFTRDKTMLTDLTYGIGGDAANQSLIFTALGVKTGIVTAPGDDTTGTGLTKMLSERGVDAANCIVKPGSRTRTSFIMVHSDGERNLLSYQIGMPQLCEQDLDLNLLDQTRMVSIGSIFMYEQLDACLEWYLTEAEKRGVITAADTMSNVKHVKLHTLAPALAHLDYFLPSYVEAEDLTGEKDPDRMADCFLSLGVKNIIIKLGMEGCLIQNAREHYRIPIFPAHCVDTTGAGDNFVAAFLTGVLQGWDLQKCGTFASAAGSIAVSGIGANSCVKSREQVIDLVKKNGRWA